jgi:drug/metabolite transporter (DMT)-like permease
MKGIKQKISGFLLVISATVIFTAGQTLIKMTACDISVFHIIFWRGVVGVIALIIIPMSKGSLVPAFKKLKKGHTIWLLLRGFFGAACMILFFTSLSMADLGEVGAFININPLFTVIFAAVFIKERHSLTAWLAVFTAIIGVFLIRNPFIQGFTAVHILLLATAVLLGFTFICINKLKTQGVESWLIVLVFTGISLIVSIPGMLIFHSPYTKELFLYLILIGLFTTAGQVLLTHSGKYIKAHSISIIALFSVFEMMMAGYLFFNEVITIQKIAGGLFIITASVLVILFQSKKE